MSDHGSTGSEVTSSWFGKLEERLPYAAFVFPHWLSHQYPEMVQNLQKNVNRLTTPLDIYETLKSFTSFNSNTNASMKNKINFGKQTRAETWSHAGKDTTLYFAGFHPQENKKSTGINLLAKVVPLTRTCEDAAIKPEWCTCLGHYRFFDPNTHLVVQAVVFEVIRIINQFLFDNIQENGPKVCSNLSLSKIKSADVWKTKSEVILSGKERDSFWFDLQSRNALEIEDGPTLPMQEDYYHVTFSTSLNQGHGHGEFEAFVIYRIVEDAIKVSPDDVHRVAWNGHGFYDDDYPRCLHQTNKKVRELCGCKL